jgi:gamma-glutamyltranspeptidase / glutathione hydrolase
MRDFHLPGRSPVYATSAMAATSVPIATLTALDVMRAGGNALDAAVAAAAVLGVVEPHNTGIGGDCFGLYAPAGEGRVLALNGSGRAPAAATIDWFEAQGITGLEPTSVHCVTVPGAVSAWETLLATHGRRGLDELLLPAIRLAEDGWPLADRVAWDWARAVEKLRAGGAEAFLPGGRAPARGHMFRQPALAETLREIAQHGSKAFYEGPVAADIVATLRARDGLHTEADFAEGAQGAEFVTPISAKWRGYEVFQCPPNGSGVAVLMLLGMLAGFETPSAGPLSTLRLHRHAEAARLAYRDRDAFVADPAQAEVPVQKLLDPAYLDGLRWLISDTAALRDLPRAGEAVLPSHRDTVYIAIVDRDGNACSFINSLYADFGTGIYAPNSGVMLHNRGYGFVVQRGHPNCIAPRKRPMHTILPGMLMKDGQAVMPYGVMGGHFQPVGQTLLLTNMIEFGMDVQQALDLPRVMTTKGKLEVESGVPMPVVEALRQLGHDVVRVEKPHGGGQAVWIDRARGVLVGGSDPRKDGLALGY